MSVATAVLAVNSSQSLPITSLFVFDYAPGHVYRVGSAGPGRSALLRAPRCAEVGDHLLVLAQIVAVGATSQGTGTAKRPTTTASSTRPAMLPEHRPMTLTHKVVVADQTFLPSETCLTCSWTTSMWRLWTNQPKNGRGSAALLRR